MSETQDRPHRASLFATNANAPRSFRALSGEVDADVCIVGASFAGLTAARTLAGHGWSVVVLEAGRVGAAGSVPHLGLVAAGYSEGVDRIIARLGVERAKELWALSAAGAQEVRRILDACGMAGAEPIVGELIVQADDNADAARMLAAQLNYFGADAETWPVERVRAALGSERYWQGVYRRDAFHIQPLNYILGLAAASEQAGVRIYENAQAVSVDAEGVRKRVQAVGGRVRAGQVVLAAGRGNGALHRGLSGTTITFARHLAATAPCEELATAMPFLGVVSPRAANAARFRREGDRLVWASPVTASSARWSAAWRARRGIARLHPQLRGAPVAHTWTASATYAAHKMPQIAELAPGLWVAGAFGDHVLATATMAGGLIARAICEGDDRWRLFSPYGMVWAGGLLGKAIVSVALPAARARAAAADLAVRIRLRRRRSSKVAAEEVTPALISQAQEERAVSADPTNSVASIPENAEKKRTPRAPRKRQAVLKPTSASKAPVAADGIDAAEGSPVPAPKRSRAPKDVLLQPKRPRAKRLPTPVSPAARAPASPNGSGLGRGEEPAQ